MAVSEAGNGEEEGVIELAPNSLTHSLFARGVVQPLPFVARPAPARFINGSFSLSVFPSFLPPPRPDVKLNVTV